MQVENFQLPPQWTLLQAEQGVALFQNTLGDSLSINYFGKVPDIEADILDAAALRAFYRKATRSSGVAMLEVDSIQIAGMRAVRTIIKLRTNPSGFAFIGSLTLPFANCSYVLKVTSVERGITGAREAAVMAMQDEPIEFDEVTGKLIGWEEDPYDPAHQGEFMRNRADAPAYDALFPEHPLSKVRIYLEELNDQLRVAPRVSALKPFEYKRPRPGIWSWLWK